MLDPETVLRDRYVILGVLAEGGNSVVYRAIDRRLPGDWIVKEMRPIAPDPSDLEAVIAQFRREAAILGTLSHPGLPRVIDCFEQAGKLYLVEELIAGQTLRGVRTDEAETVRCAEALLDVLAYLHEHGIIYRDLKPDNVIRTPDGHYHLIDFGIARLYSVGRRRDTVLMGTPGFASPEHYGNKQTDARSDIYGLGALLHYLCTGRDPAERPFLFEPPDEGNTGINEWLADIIMTALEQEPAERFQSASEMKKALQDKTLQRARAFRYPRPPSVLPRWERPVQAAAAVSGGVGLTTLLAAGTALIPVAGFLLAPPILLLGRYLSSSRDLRDLHFVATPRELQVWKGDVPRRIRWDDVIGVRVHKYQRLTTRDIGVAYVDVCWRTGPGPTPGRTERGRPRSLRGERAEPDSPLEGPHAEVAWARWTSELEGWDLLLQTVIGRADLRAVPRTGSMLADEEYWK